MRTAAIISYSSYHNAYIERCIEEAKKAAEHVMVVSYDHFFDGVEDTELLKLDGVQHLILHNEPQATDHARSFHNEQRKQAYKELEGEYDAVFFIDSDEILEGDRVKQWLINEVQQGEDYKLAHFWYYRDTCYRSNVIEEGAILVSTETLTSSGINWYGERERENYSTTWNYMAGYKRNVLGHHYSWAGTKDMIMRKVASWAIMKTTQIGSLL